MGTENRGRWIMLTGFAVIVGVFEAIGAALIFSLLAVVTGQADSLEVPGLGTLHRRFPRLGEENMLLLAASIVAIFFLLRGVAYLVQAYLRNKMAHEAGVRVAAQLFKGYMRAPYSLHLQRNSAELIRNLHTSTYELVDNILVPVVGLASELLLVGAVLAVLVGIAPVPTLVTIVILGPTTFAMLRYVQPRLVRLGAESQELHRINLQAMQQSFQGIRETKILQKEAYFEKLFERTRAEAARTYYVRSTLMDTPRVLVETTLILFILGFLIVAENSPGSVQSTLPILGLFAYASFRLMPSLNRILAFSNTLRFGSAAVEILYDELPVIREGQAQKDFSNGQQLEQEIKVDQVSFRYQEGHREVVKDVNLTIRRGESLGIVGATGSGKSTLIDLIMGLLEPSDGKITVDGHDIHLDLSSWHAQIGMVSQSVFLLDDSIRNNIAFGHDQSEIDEDRLIEVVSIAQLDSFISSLPDGLETIVGERGVRLSGGQRQRIAIARALYKKPTILVLDEGTSALDNSTESNLMEALKTLAAKTTLIMVAHRVSTVRNCDVVILMRSGSIADSGTFDDLTHRHAALT